MEFAEDVRWRRSQRGLVIGSSSGEAVLLEHPRAGQLPDVLADRPERVVLAERLGPPNGASLIEEMSDAGLLVDEPAAGLPLAGSASAAAPGGQARERRVVVTRSGMEFPGIAIPAAWIQRRLSPLWCSWPGRGALALIVAAGIAALVAGRPDGPAVSSHPWVDALLGFTISMACSALHELAHAVALMHYGRRPRRAGFGFYWGGISFYVDSTDALTLPRRARVTQALVGLGVDVVTTSVLAITAQLVAHLASPDSAGAGAAGAAAGGAVLIWAVAWRVAVLATLGIGLNALPILQVDGHWALADYLDEPDLATRARASLGAAARSALRRTPTSRGGDEQDRAENGPALGIVQEPRWMVAYGAVSTLGGLLALGLAVPVWWFAAGDLIRALFAGNPAEIVVAVVLVGPFAASLLISTLGLFLELLPTNPHPAAASTPDPSTTDPSTAASPATSTPAG